MKSVLVGRHQLLEGQKKALDELGIQIEKQVVNIDDPQKFVQEVANLGVDVIVIQALPLPILAQILQSAKRHGIKVYMFNQGKAEIFDNKEEAEKYIQELPEYRVLLASPTDNKFRVVEFTSVEEVQEIRIVTKTVWKSPYS